jgi:hypothetical protein
MPTAEEIALLKAHNEAFATAMRESFPDVDGFLTLSPAEPDGPAGEHEAELDPRFDWGEDAESDQQ